MTDTTSPTTASLQDMTPPQIDGELNRLGYQRAVLIARINGLRDSARRLRIGRYADITRAERLEHQAAEYEPRVVALSAQIQPYDDEYDRRGGWPRAFLVQSNNGHVHSSTGCSSCYPTTQYAWLTDYSGKTEEQIVWAAGELACTICFSSAPTSALKRVGEIRRPSDVEREQRAAEKAAKAQAAAADAVTDPNTGRTLYKTDRSATNALSTVMSSLRWYGDEHPSADEWKASITTIIDALAVKHDADPAALLAEYNAKADKKFDAQARKALREHHGEIVVDNLVAGLQTWVKANGIPV